VEKGNFKINSYKGRKMKFLGSIFIGFMVMIGWIIWLGQFLLSSFFLILFAVSAIAIMVVSVDYFKEGRWLYGIGANLFALLILAFVIGIAWSNIDEWREDRKQSKETGI
jgi:hypothetical protein